MQMRESSSPSILSLLWGSVALPRKKFTLPFFPFLDLYPRMGIRGYKSRKVFKFHTLEHELKHISATKIKTVFAKVSCCTIIDSIYTTAAASENNRLPLEY